MEYVDHIEEWFKNAYRVHLTGIEDPIVMSRRFAARLERNLSLNRSLLLDASVALVKDEWSGHFRQRQNTHSSSFGHIGTRRRRDGLDSLILICELPPLPFCRSEANIAACRIPL